MPLPPNTRLDRYEIRAQIGAGGMGEVYLAEDTRLRRRVALKVLPDNVASDKERLLRFEREAVAASALNHPNIITIYEIGESEGTHFIATELIDGKTLGEYARAHRLDDKAVLEIAIQIASALTEAHEAGIVHRDIKPDNVMVRPNGLVKILDFGIAKLSAPSESSAEAATAIKSSTQAGMIIGTASYMSPEQAAGRAVDARSDIFSFGVVLYEMLSGRLPFAGETAMEMIGAILKDEPPPLGACVPVELKEIVAKCLRKNLSERYQAIKEACTDLREFKQELEFQDKLERTSAPNRAEQQTQILQAQATAEESPQATTRVQQSIAVLPFSNIGGDAENEYFCDGLAEELLNALSKIEDLRVAARTSAFSFKGKNAEAREIGEKLSVKNILEGSVRRSGNKLRIAVQLINAANGFQLWSERYDREMKDIFDVQDEISLAVVDALKVKLFGEEKAAVLKRHTRNAEAHEYYLRGLFHFNRFTPDGFQKAIEYFNRAIAVDNRYASAFAGLANAYVEMAFFTFSAPGEWMPKARKAVNTALALDATLDEAHNSLAIIKMYYDLDYPGAEREFKRALALNPGNSNICMWYAWYLGLMGRFEESFEAYRRALELDPLSEMINTSVGIVYYWAGQQTRAVTRLQKVLEVNPHYSLAQSFLAEAYAQRGDFAAAAATAASLRQSANDPLTLPTIGYVYGKIGDRQAAQEILTAVEQRATREYVSALNFAQIYAGLGDTEQTLAWLEKACRERPFWITFVKVDPKFDFLRSDPRFIEMLNRIGFPPEKSVQTDEALEAKTVMLQPDTADKTAEVEQVPESTTNPKYKIRNPKSKWWLFGLIGLLLLVGGYFGYRYFAPTNRQINSIAVLPFENRSGDADSEYLSDGLAESLIYRLSQLPNLKVSPTSSVFHYKGKGVDAKQVADELGVDAVMTGRMTQRGDDLTISVELIDTRNNKTLWGEQYERKLSELLTTQREIAAEIVSKLQLKLSGEGEQKLAKKYTDSPEAYQLYLKGRFYWNKRTSEALRQAAEFYKQAIEKDPNFALAYSGLAETYVLFSSHDVALADDSMPQAKAAALRALELDDQLAEAHAALGFYLSNYEWNRGGSEKEYRRAIELKPNYATAHQWLGAELADVKRFDESLVELKRAEELDPLSPIIGTNLGDVLSFAHRYDEAIAQYKRVLVREPDFPYAHQDLGSVYGAKKMYAEAIAETRLATEPSDKGFLGLWLAKAGKRDEALKLLDELKQESARGYVQSFTIALIYIGLGNKEEALNYLEKEMSGHSENASGFAVFTELDELRDEPRFKTMLKKMNLPE
jgi:serine/threonine-protein kinase